MPDYRRFYVPGHPVFVTLVTSQRRPWLADSERVTWLLNAMRRVKAFRPFRHIAHVVMPDHFHWLLEPRDADFSSIIGAVKRDVTWRLKEGGGNGLPPYWQPRFFDHVIRDQRDLQRHLDYIHFNPVKHGVAAGPADHPHSSFAEWCRRGAYEPGWGHTEPVEIAEMNLE